MQTIMDFDALTKVAELPIVGSSSVVLVDAIDAQLLAIYAKAWRLTPKGYPFCNAKVDGRNKLLMLHRIIMGFPQKPLQVDHIDGNKLNNRRCNLRLCTGSQNLANRRKQSKSPTTSKYKGVDFRQATNKFRASAHWSGKYLHFGTFLTAEDAARAYDRAALEHFGEFARTNFPREQYA